MNESLPATTPPGPQARALAQRMVRTLVGKTLTFFVDQQSTLIKRVRVQLLDKADGKLSLAQGQNLRSAAVLLDRQAETFQRCFADAMQKCLNDEIRSAFPQLENIAHRDASANPDPEGMSLSLVDMEEVHRILLLDRVSQTFNTAYEPALTALSQKLAVLFGIETASLLNNPFRPGIFLKAFMTAWEKGGFDDQATEDLMATFAPETSLDLAPLYKDLTAVLTQAGIQASGGHRIRKAPNAPSGFAPLSDSSLGPLTASPSAFAPIAGEQTKSAWGALAPVGRTIATQARAFLNLLGVGQIAPEGSEPPALQAADPTLLHYLQNIQADAGAPSEYQGAPGQDTGVHNVLRNMRDSQAVRSAPELDRGTVDALAEVFDYVFSDQAIPTQLKVIIGRLQIPVLKAAMIDRDFFLSGDHPARKLVDTLASASVSWTPEKGEQDPLYVRIEHTVQRVLNEFEDDLAVFSDLLLDFTEFLFETEQQAQHQIAPVAAQELGVESLALARAQSDEIIHGRISALNPELPLAPFLAPFLTTQWREVLATAWLQKEVDPSAWSRALETMDSLIWSTQPKTTSEDRRKLVEVLPDMIRNLNAGLDGIQWDGDDRATFTRRLIATHMLAIRMKAPPPLDSQSATLEETQSIEAMTALDQRRASQLTGGVDGFDDAAHALSRGLWFELSPADGPAYRCRLTWVSPMRTRLLFTNREGHDAFVRSEREVAAMLRLGSLSILEQTPIVSRAIDRLMAGNDSEMQLQT